MSFSAKDIHQLLCPSYEAFLRLTRTGKCVRCFHPARNPIAWISVQAGETSDFSMCGPGGDMCLPYLPHDYLNRYVREQAQEEKAAPAPKPKRRAPRENKQVAKRQRVATVDLTESDDDDDQDDVSLAVLFPQAQRLRRQQQLRQVQQAEQRLAAHYKISLEALRARLSQ